MDHIFKKIIINLKFLNIFVFFKWEADVKHEVSERMKIKVRKKLKQNNIDQNKYDTALFFSRICRL